MHGECNEVFWFDLSSRNRETTQTFHVSCCLMLEHTHTRLHTCTCTYTDIRTSQPNLLNSLMWLFSRRNL